MYLQWLDRWFGQAIQITTSECFKIKIPETRYLRRYCGSIKVSCNLVSNQLLQCRELSSLLESLWLSAKWTSLSLSRVYGATEWSRRFFNLRKLKLTQWSMFWLDYISIFLQTEDHYYWYAYIHMGKKKNNLHLLKNLPKNY
jgi:hypothetical protein